MKYSVSLPKTFLGLWSILGFYRGYQSYETTNHTIQPLNKPKINTTNTIMKSIGYGFCGMFIYLNPIAFPIIIESEYKRVFRKQ